LFDRLRPHKKRRYRVPSLVSYLLNVSVLSSVPRQSASRKQTDLCFNLRLACVGFLQGCRFTSIVAQGAARAREVMDPLSPAEKQAWGIKTT
jgi:NTE family protein